MKKSLVLGAAVAAMSISTAASAINAPGYRGSLAPMASDGLGNVGLVYSILATGAVGQDFCGYILSWQSPYNPNDVVSCVLREARGTVNPSCIANSTANIPTSVLAGQTVSTSCNGFDLLGAPLTGISLFLSETNAGVGSAFSGVLFHPNLGMLPIRF